MLSKPPKPISGFKDRPQNYRPEPWGRIPFSGPAENPDEAEEQIRERVQLEVMEQLETPQLNPVDFLV